MCNTNKDECVYVCMYNERTIRLTEIYRIYQICNITLYIKDMYFGAIYLLILI